MIAMLSVYQVCGYLYLFVRKENGDFNYIFSHHLTYSLWYVHSLTLLNNSNKQITYPQWSKRAIEAQ